MSVGWLYGSRLALVWFLFLPLRHWQRGQRTGQGMHSVAVRVATAAPCARCSRDAAVGYGFPGNLSPGAS